MRTNIEIDDKVMEQAFSISTFKTKKEIVEQALKEFVQNRARKDLADMGMHFTNQCLQLQCFLLYIRGVFFRKNS
jgi:Arc/MetJ family transcription regulator